MKMYFYFVIYVAKTVKVQIEMKIYADQSSVNITVEQANDEIEGAWFFFSF